MENMALLFQSLDDVTRLRILALLLEEEDLCVCYLVAVLQLPQSTVSRQLGVLKSAGWLKDRREGVWIHYSINRSLGAIQQFLVPVLRTFLLGTETARGDLERLKNLPREGGAVLPGTR
ncbi:transcriptional regulator [Geomonas silvestris]|uniref:Transcriptional regulator n=1 Tax=Geomonas silvestris TaxID=2740184 RepID=A0A6V8MQS9_9BACT|nr:metalloregulator ArsR/SmtB family transcription factor [Geomonas silvestris]GFO61949.1 transcriptional regulator [Geomonas silvestris]